MKSYLVGESTTGMTANQRYWLLFTASLVIAYVGWISPSHQMPLNYDALKSRSVPLAIAWGLALIFSLWRYKKRGLWLIVGAPLALYWPVWLLFNNFPPCYYSHNCT